VVVEWITSLPEYRTAVGGCAVVPWAPEPSPWRPVHFKVDFHARVGGVVPTHLRVAPARVSDVRGHAADRGVSHAGYGDRPKLDASPYPRRLEESARRASCAFNRLTRRSWREASTDLHPQAPARPLIVPPRAPAHRLGPFGERGFPDSVRCRGRELRRGAGRAARNASGFAKDHVRSTPEVVARRTAPG
jgi:hypothetical protein